jgi:hypothetical protein
MGTPQGNQRVARSIQSAEYRPEVRQRTERLRLQLHGVLKFDTRRIKGTASQIYGPQIAVRRRIPWIYFQRRHNQSPCFFEPTLLQGDDTE